MGRTDVKPDDARANPTAGNLNATEEEHLYDILDVALGKIRRSMIQDLSSSSQILTTVARHYAEQPSKYLRPVLIVLMGCATDKDSVKGGLDSEGLQFREKHLDLAEAVEMLHIASLLHDDVIDNASSRRGAPSAPQLFGNKNTILAGDFMIGRSMTLCASLDHSAVMSIFSGLVSSLVEGELLQADEIEDWKDATREDNSIALPDWEVYLTKTYLKTGSLISKALRCSALLNVGSEDNLWVDAAATYGTELGMAFQLIDDVLDFEEGTNMGKPTEGADLKLGIITVPIYLALEEDPSMRPLINRRFKGPGDIEEAIRIVRKGKALPRSRELALSYSKKACKALQIFPPSPARSALEKVAMKVVERKM